MGLTQKSFTPRAGEIKHAWRVIDADGKTLGRLASEIAGYLRGKHLPTYSEHMDVGDHVIVVNASRIHVTGNKLRAKLYYRHSTYPGGLKSVALGDMLARHPERVIEHAVKGMIPHNALGRKMLAKLKVYGGANHPHQAQITGWERSLTKQGAPAAKAEVSEPVPAAVVTAGVPTKTDTKAQASPAESSENQEQSA